MNLTESFKLVIKNMLEKKGRVFFTLAGIIIGIFTFTFFMFVSQGLENAIYEQFSSLGTNVLGVQKAGNGHNGPPVGEGLTDTDINKIKQVIREYIYIAPAITSNIKYEYGNEKSNAYTLAYQDETLNAVLEDFSIEMEEGRSIRTGDKGVITIGNKLATDVFKNRKIKVGNSLKVGDKSFRVVGIYKSQGDLFIDSSVFMSFEDIKKVINQDTYTMIRIKFQEGVDLEYYEQVIDKKMNPRGKEKEVEITSPNQVQEQFNQIIGLLTAIIGFISSIALIVGGINVMNTMYSNVIERTNEISVMKAMGAKNSNILTLFLLESSILGVIGGTTGFFLSYGLAELLSFAITNFAGYNVPIYFNTTFMIVIIGITTIITTIFGTYPAIRAAHINPADKLKDD